jgi:hypothetical protein
MATFFLQPFPETRPLIGAEASLYEEKGGARRIISEIAANRDGALYVFGEKLGCKLTFSGTGAPNYLFGENYEINVAVFPKLGIRVYVER